ncbi:hypothetical protein, partial [Blautia sp. CAG:257]|uniref:hypothetical protein n=1 Tax=Blautia sp. CAG:257 TaxID=1262756 RepID=UPI000A7FB5EE
MGILKVAGKVLLIPLWFIISIIGAGVKLLVHMVAIAKKILGFGIMALLIGTVICYQDWLQAAFLACMGGVLISILFAGEFIDTGKSVIDSIVVYCFNHRCRSETTSTYGGNRKKDIGIWNCSFVYRNSALLSRLDTGSFF